MDRSVSCCFSGHRPAKLPWGTNETDPRCLALKEELAARLEGVCEAGYRHFICGMAAGCDLYFAEAVIALRRERPEITLEAAIPCDGQAENWPEPQRRRYEAMVADCDEVTVLQHAYTPGCMQRRNRYMLERSSLLLACSSGQPGGTRSTILEAMREGLRVVLIDL